MSQRLAPLVKRKNEILCPILRPFLETHQGVFRTGAVYVSLYSGRITESTTTVEVKVGEERTKEQNVTANISHSY